MPNEVVSQNTNQLIQIDALHRIIGLEPYVLLSTLLVITWFFYQLFLKNVSDERHRNIRNQFRQILQNFLFLNLLYFCFSFLHSISAEWPNTSRILPYLGLLTFIWGSITFVKTCRLLILQYLFLGSMQHGVPMLMVNIFSLLLSVLLAFWGVGHIFGLQLGPLIATSAAFSIILGLALQDTLGNLFAGISLQLDRNYEIGNWIEVVSGIQRCVGQVKEISWRSTTLIGLSDEIITLPNRFVAQAQVSNYSPEHHPIIRSQNFRFEYTTDLNQAKTILERAAAEISGVRGIPAPLAYIHETNENWVNMKLIYFIDNYGSQYSIGDKVQRRSIELLLEHDIKLAYQKMELYHANQQPG